MRIWKIFLLSLVVLFVFWGNDLRAQRTMIYTSEERLYNDGLELFDKGKYAAAQERFGQLMKKVDKPQSEIYINSEYYYARCALTLFHPDAEFLLQQFIENHPEAPQVRTIYFLLGNHFYQNKKFKKALEYYEGIDKFDLKTDELAEFYFKSGYSYLQVKREKEAMASFFEIIGTENTYRDPALYYYSHISYTNGNYQTALEGFLKLKESPSFKHKIPFYVAQIYYLQGKYDEVISYAPPIYDTTRDVKKNELARLIGDSFYRLKKYDLAVPYLEKFFKTVTPTREENYQMGYAYYRSGFYDKSVPFFNKATNQKDEMGQLAYYHMGESYIRMNEKTYARNAYEGAAEIDLNREIQEDALFSYAKLAYELSYNPFHDAIKALNRYLDKYPESRRRDEAYSFLINVYMTTRNYEEAERAISKVKNKDFRVQTAYQLVVFNRGVELFQNGKYSEAISFFEKVKTYPIERKLNFESKYWIAESWYALREYDKAIPSFAQFQAEPGASGSPMYARANYSIAYCYYQKMMDQMNEGKKEPDQELLNSSLYTFRKFITDNSEKEKFRVTDAQLRTADLYYLKKENSSAADFYDQAYKSGEGARDYALFQLGICQTLLKKNSEAISAYKKLINEFPQSRYVQEAMYEIAETYRLIDDRGPAVNYYEQFISKYPNNQKVRKALLHIGLIHYRDKNYVKSEKYYRQVLDNYKNPDDISAALAGLKPVLTEQSRVDEWVELVKKYDTQGGSDKEIENTLWELAENAYMEGNCDKSIEGVNKYLQQYPNGYYKIQAHFFRAECNFIQGREDLAKNDYEIVINGPSNLYYEQALVRLAGVEYNKRDFAKAKQYYLNLEKIASKATNVLVAQIGCMRTSYELKEYADAMKYAQIVLKDASIDKDLKGESHFIMGMSELSTLELDKAAADLKTASGLLSGKRWAESKYNLCYIQFLKGDYKKTEKEIFDYVKIRPNYDYWLAKSYILLADNYLKLEDAFQAKATLKSIIDNYSADDDIVPTAQQKYDEIIRQEEEENNKRMMPVPVEGENGEAGEDDKSIDLNNGVPENEKPENNEEGGNDE